MKTRNLAAIAIVLMASRMTLADASYQETTQITGGSMVAPLKSMGFLSKSVGNMFAPNTTTTMVHGNQKAVVGKDSTEITDLDRETITHIDNLHKTYSVVTFAQMRQAFENMPKQMEQAQEKAKQDQPQQPQQPKSDLKTSFDVSVKNTGVSKDVNGLTAQEQLVTMQMHVTDPNAPPTDATNTVTYVVTTDAWIAPDPPEVKEVQEFDKKFGHEADGRRRYVGVEITNGRPKSCHGADVWRQTRIPGSHGPDGQRNGKAPGHPGHGSHAHGWERKWRAPRRTRRKDQLRGEHPPASSNTSVGGLLGSALGGSALGGFHRKKPAPADTNNSTTPAADGSQTASSAVLMETTTQKSNFSAGECSLVCFRSAGWIQES